MLRHTSSAPLVMPTATRQAPSVAGEDATARAAIDTPNDTVAAASARGSRPRASRPVNTMAGIAPTATSVSSRPSDPVETPTRCCTAGMNPLQAPQNRPHAAQTAISR
jgi:hypothetical protein